MASKELDALIAQHLRKHGRTKTLAAFIKECHPVLEEAPSEDLDALMTWYRTENAAKKQDNAHDDKGAVQPVVEEKPKEEVAEAASKEQKTTVNPKLDVKPNRKGRKAKTGKEVQGEKQAADSNENEVAGTGAENQEEVVNATEEAGPKKKGRKANKAGEGEQKAADIQSEVVKEQEIVIEPKQKGRKAKKAKEGEEEAKAKGSRSENGAETGFKDEDLIVNATEDAEPKKKGKKDKVVQKAAATQAKDSATEEKEQEQETAIAPKKKGKKADEVEEKSVPEPTSNKRKTRNSNKPVESENVPEEVPKKKAKKAKASKVEQAVPEKTISTEAVVDNKPGEANEEAAKPDQMEVDKDANAVVNGDNLDVPEPQKKKKGRKSAKAGKKDAQEENHKEEETEQPEPAAKKQKKEKANSMEPGKEEQIKEVDDQLVEKDDTATGLQPDSVTATNGDEVLEEEEKTPNSGKQKKADNEKGIKPFQRVKPDEVEFLDERLKDNSYWAKDGAENGWGAKAQEVLGQVKGRGFRHEKTKKKRGTYRGGAIDTQSHSIKFNYD